MQRQSLGSPASKLKLHSTVGVAISKDEPILSLTFSSENQSSSVFTTGLQEEAHKSQKLKAQKPKSAEYYIHLIPILTLLCFLILYLSSHDPSQYDLIQSKGLSIDKEIRDDVDELQRILDMKKGEIIAIRSLKNINKQEIGREISRNRLHRKIADF